MKRLGLAFLFIAVGLAAIATFFVANGLAEEENRYVGSKKCKMCHTKEYKSWEKTKHGAAFDSLSDAEKKDPEVLKERTTGYGKPGGFKSVEETPELANVGCEMCHGPGGKHVDVPLSDKEAKKASAQTPAGKNVCIGCHEPHETKK